MPNYLLSVRQYLLLAGYSAVLSGCNSNEPPGAVAMQSATGAALTRVATGDAGAAAAVQAACVPGNWSVVAMPDAPAVRLESAHFAIRWTGTTPTQALAQQAATELESIYSQFTGEIGFPEPSCNSASKKKINIWVGDFGLSGGVDGAGNPGMWIGVGGLSDRFGLAHELTHALQGGSGGLRDSPFVGWMWESHANWMATQRPEYRNNVHCSELLVNAPHVYYGSTRNRYCNFQFWEYLKNRYGYGIVNDIWRNAPKIGEAGYLTADPFTVLRTNMGWSVAQLNDVFGDWAMHNVTWDYVDPDGTDRSANMRASYGGYDAVETGNIGYNGYRFGRTTRLDPINASLRRYAVSPAQAPQRWGYNIVRLVPDAGAGSVTVAFRGVTQSAAANTSFPGLPNEPTSVPAPASGWRWGLVAVGSNDKPRYGALQTSANGSASITLQSGDKGLYLVVVGAPSAHHAIRWDQPYYSIYRYPWMVQLTNAYPKGQEPGVAAPIAGGHQHANGGGWVGPNASVASTAYVGPYARVYTGTVSGTARIEDHAIVYGGTVSGSAVVGGLSVVAGNSALQNNARAWTSFMPLGYFEPNILVSGSGRVLGDVEYRGGAQISGGAFYGIIDPAIVAAPNQGAQLTAPVQEVTAAPAYNW